MLIVNQSQSRFAEKAILIGLICMSIQVIPVRLPGYRGRSGVHPARVRQQHLTMASGETRHVMRDSATHERKPVMPLGLPSRKRSRELDALRLPMGAAAGSAY